MQKAVIRAVQERADCDPLGEDETAAQFESYFSGRSVPEEERQRCAERLRSKRGELITRAQTELEVEEASELPEELPFEGPDGTEVARKLDKRKVANDARTAILGENPRPRREQIRFALPDGLKSVYRRNVLYERCTHWELAVYCPTWIVGSGPTQALQCRFRRCLHALLTKRRQRASRVQRVAGLFVDVRGRAAVTGSEELAESRRGHTTNARCDNSCTHRGAEKQRADWPGLFLVFLGCVGLSALFSPVVFPQAEETSTAFQEDSR